MLVLMAAAVVGGVTTGVGRSNSPFAVRSSSGSAWTNRFPAARPTFSFFTHLAYDVKSDRTVVFGGNSIDLQETWSYDSDNNTWTNMQPADRPPGVNSPLVYDSQSDRFIYFGGLVWCGNRECVTRSDETWAYNLESNTWTNMNPTAKPPRTFGDHAMAYDSRSDRIIWYASFLDAQQTWAYDFDTNTWTNMNPAVSPNLAYATMAYDSQSDRMILFGADGNETWAYDFDHNSWTNVTPSQSPALYQESPSMAYDSESDRVILLGSPHQVYVQGIPWVYRETWAYDFETNTWTNMDPVAGPWDSGRLTYDSRSDRVILFGGQATNGYPWAYDLNANVWANLHPTDWPILSGMTAYDSESNRTVLFAWGFAGAPVSETWTYRFDTNVWTNMRPASMPSARYDASIAYDSQSDRVILFAGARYGAFPPVQNDDTWAYDPKTNSWTNMNPAIGPSARQGHAMAYDSESDRVILFGGLGGAESGSPNGETWAYDFRANAWTDMKPAVAPSARLWHGMAYDSKADRVVLFGGLRSDASGTARSDETWAYDFNTNTWTEMTSATKPSPRIHSLVAYDSRSDRIILFGGFAEATETDTWSYEVGSRSWTDLTAAGRPSATCIGCGGFAYDSQADRLVLYTWNADGQTWAFDYEAALGNLGPIPGSNTGWESLVLGAVVVAAVVGVAVGVWYFRRRHKPSEAPPPPTPPDEDQRP